MTKYRKPFYASEMHNDSNFSVHHYFTTDVESRGLSRLKEFVDVPCPFGVQNTYKYLRKANINKLPFITETKIYKSRNLLNNLDTTVSKKDNYRSISSNFSAHTIQASIYHKKTQFIIRVCMFEQIKQVKDFSQYCISIDLMKFMRNCFLKCKLHLDTLTLTQFRALEKYILPTLKNKNRKGRELESPLVLLGVLEMKTKEDLLNKLKQLDEQGKVIEIYKLIQHFIIPDEQIVRYQLESILQQINKAYKFKKITNVNEITSLFLLDGTEVQTFFQLTTNDPIIIGTPYSIKQCQLSHLRQSLKNQILQQQKIKRQNWIKGIVKADRFNHKNSLFITKPRSYDNIDLSLKKRRDRQIRSSMKGKYSISKVNKPFIGKQDLVREYDIFNI